MPTIFFLIFFYYIFQHLFFLRWLQYSINFRHIHIWINNRHHYTITSQLVCEHTRTPYFSRVLFFFFWQQRSFVKESFRHNKWFLFDFQGWIEVLVFVWQKSLKFLKFFFFPFLASAASPHALLQYNIGGAQCGNFGNLLLPIFRQKFREINAFSNRYLSYTECCLHEILFQVRVNFSFFHTVCW